MKCKKLVKYGIFSSPLTIPDEKYIFLTKLLGKQLNSRDHLPHVNGLNLCHSKLEELGKFPFLIYTLLYMFLSLTNNIHNLIFPCFLSKSHFQPIGDFP